MPKLKAIFVGSLCFLLIFMCGVARGAPQTGWYWNPDESGRGFFVESRDGVTFIGAYLYDADGHALWLVSGGPNDDSYNWTGDLHYMTNGQTLYGSYVSPGNGEIVGTLSAHFTDDTHATITWPGGTVKIERHIFGTGDATFQPDSGWWWNPNEGGSGYSLEVQGGNLFIVGFMYDETGRPVWYFSAGPMASATTYHGDLLQFANGQTMGGAYLPPAPPTKIATLDIEFTATNEALLTFNEAAAQAKKFTAKDGRSSDRSLQPQFPDVTTYTPSTKFSGYFSANSMTHDTSMLGMIYDAQQTIRLDFGWDRYLGVAPLAHRDGMVGAQYLVDYSNATITRTFNATSVTSAGTCTQKGSHTLALGNTASDLLNVMTSRKYYLDVYVDWGDLLPVTQTCEFSNGDKIETLIILPMAGFEFNYEGVVVGDTFGGTGTRTISEGAFQNSVYFDWSFIGM